LVFEVGIIGFMMWLWISAIVLLVGAELNSEIESTPSAKDDVHPGTIAIGAGNKLPEGTVAYEANAATSQQQGGSDAPNRDMQMPGMKMPMQPGPAGHQHHH
jgi:hypothetical protein